MKNQVKEIINSYPDPLEVRKSTAHIFSNLTLIDIDFDKIEEIAEVVKRKADNNQVLTEDQFGSSEPTPQLVFVLDTVNFCFWAHKDKEKWTIEYPKGNFIANGWFALVASIERARQENIPILDADYLSDISLAEAEYIFRSSNETKIPLLEKRVEHLREAGRVLKEKFEGNIYNFLADTGLDVGKISTEVAKNFSSYEDYSMLNGQKVNFYKRAQIFAYDLALLSPLKAENLETLTAFADYKVPQTLRAFGITNYEPSLADKVDNYVILENNSVEEVEIRAVTIWACELIAHQAGINPVLVDNVLWKISQSLKDVKPYHRVLSTKY